MHGGEPQPELKAGTSLQRGLDVKLRGSPRALMKEPGDQMGVLKSHPTSFGREGGPEWGPSRKLGDEITVNSPHLRKLELYFYSLDE